MHDPVPAAISPGIYDAISLESYHAGPGISKTGLWDIYTRSPAHYRFGAREESPAFDVGTAAHLAILQPDSFETMVWRGPADRRGNGWKDAQAEANRQGKLLLTAPDHDGVLAMRDAVHADPWVNAIITGGKPMIEHSAYAIDRASGALVRCRPDLHRADLGVMLDVKTAISARGDEFSRAVISYGYHAQEAHYTDTWRAAGGSVEAFAFLVIEKKAPFAFAVYELPPSIVDEGRAAMRKALTTYAACQRSGQWPGYPTGVQELEFKPWSYRETEAPQPVAT